ncbi:MAG TPA: SUF system NifU family Fe-S cluster assembly protein [Vicinamibacterales bacterium]|jgi:nitrogen fixation NifU-like protein|nr:SUF system NifU family Fe-S cluster assembly protein [Vicinamibacterales bacterium]
MSDLSDLYQEVILDHNRRPRNYGALAGADRQAHGHNPLCGDRLTVYLRVEGDVIREVQFEGSGCAISKASASLMTDAIKGLRAQDALALFDRMQTMLTTPIDRAIDESSFGKLAALAGVREFPMRVKCATLSWHTFKAALAADSHVAKTE